MLRLLREIACGEGRKSFLFKIEKFAIFLFFSYLTLNIYLGSAEKGYYFP